MTERIGDRKFEIEHRRVSSSSAKDIVDLILDPTTWPRWQPEITSARGPKTLVAGATVEGTATLLGFDVEGRSNAVLVTEEVLEEDVIVGVRMRVRYEVTGSDEGTIVIRNLSAVLPGGFSGKLLSFFLKRRLRRMQRTLLDELVAQAESV